MTTPVTSTHTTPRRNVLTWRSRVDDALREALDLHVYSETAWRELKESGGSDDDISHRLVDQWGNGVGSSTDSGIQFAVKGLPVPLFWVDASSHHTTAKPTLEGKKLVRRVRELLEIPPPGTPSPDAASVDEQPEPTLKERTEATLELRDRLKKDGWKFKDYADGRWMAAHKARGLKTGKHDGLVEVIHEAARLAEAHTAEIEDAGSQAESSEGSVYEGQDAETLLEATEREQRERWEALKLTEEAITTIRKSRRRDQLEKERDELRTVYAATWSELSDATSPQVANDLRNRIEGLEVEPTATPGDDSELSTIDADGEASSFPQLGYGCPLNCDHTEKEHLAFEIGLAAGEQGLRAEDCALEGLEREAWLYGQSVGAANRAAAVPAADGDVVEHTPAPDAAPETRIFKSVVEVKLNDHDIADKARRASLLNLQIEELEAEKDSTAKTYKKKIDGLEEERDKLMREIRAGRDELELEVFERRDYERHVVELRRADTCELISERPMKPTEYQPPLLSF